MSQKTEEARLLWGGHSAPSTLQGTRDFRAYYTDELNLSHQRELLLWGALYTTRRGLIQCSWLLPAQREITLDSCRCAAGLDFSPLPRSLEPESRLPQISLMLKLHGGIRFPHDPQGLAPLQLGESYETVPCLGGSAWGWVEAVPRITSCLDC